MDDRKLTESTTRRRLTALFVLAFPACSLFAKEAALAKDATAQLKMTAAEVRRTFRIFQTEDGAIARGAMIVALTLENAGDSEYTLLLDSFIRVQLDQEAPVEVDLPIWIEQRVVFGEQLAFLNWLAREGHIPKEDSLEAYWKNHRDLMAFLRKPSTADLLTMRAGERLVLEVCVKGPAAYQRAVDKRRARDGPHGPLRPPWVGPFPYPAKCYMDLPVGRRFRLTFSISSPEGRRRWILSYSESAKTSEFSRYLRSARFSQRKEDTKRPRRKFGWVRIAQASIETSLAVKGD